MVDSPKKRGALDVAELREMLYGDVPLAEWKARDAAGNELEPWSLFEAARRAIAKGDTNSAVHALRYVANDPHAESRHLLQAWHALRALGIVPASDVATRAHGVVLDVHLDAGLDTLAAYADHRARYFNHGGKVIVWEATDVLVQQRTDDLLRLGQVIAGATGPWGKLRPPPPRVGHVRISVLTPGGLHFGEGSFDELSRDTMGGPTITAGTRLMRALVERTTKSPG